MKTQGWSLELIILSYNSSKYGIDNEFITLKLFPAASRETEALSHLEKANYSTE